MLVRFGGSLWRVRLCVALMINDYLMCWSLMINRCVIAAAGSRVVLWLRNVRRSTMLADGYR
jgi:hypothetical protein